MQSVFLNIIETVRSIKKKIKIYQASTSELYGLIQKPLQNEKTPFYPRSPYSTSKLFLTGYQKIIENPMVCLFAMGFYSIMSLQEEVETFVTRKITIGLSRIVAGLDKHLELGNLYAMRDWGHAMEYAKMQWQILQQRKPDDFVISTGKNFSIKYFSHYVVKY